VNNLKEYTIRRLKHELTFQEFLALKDVDLHVKKGESWGLIGTNGSGKSTLLKTITGIMKPYKGTVKVRGKIAPMIELGAGFDQELTARENIFLNGAVLGHSRKFMEEHFDEIVEFAELQRFLNSPIKNYSSGMKARLGFAVATMVDPDILICDEVLAVGDEAFRRRCEERMQQMLSGGTTLLYVSHDIDSVKQLCDHVLWLDHGEVLMSGDPDTVCDAYARRLDKVYSFRRKLEEDREQLEREAFERFGPHFLNVRV
jgi:lipopolysaccharide transport system ATP-binding protein